jgi:hypothetical protein
MKKLNFVMALIIAATAIPAYAASIVDGDFNNWSFGTTGTATVVREAIGGDPDARLNITTVSGPTVWGTAIKNDFSTTQTLSGTQFELEIDVLSGPGAIDDGQRILLLVQQNSNLYGADLGITGFPRNWDPFISFGSFMDSSFDLLSGTGPATPDFGGGINTFFGFAAGNTNSGTLTQYYDNFNLQIVPIPPTIWLFGIALLTLFGFRLRQKT